MFPLSLVVRQAIIGSHENALMIAHNCHESSYPRVVMAPTVNRQKCYEARDKFFQCVDKFKSDDEVVKNCMKLKDEFEQACPPSWVHHFVLQRQTKAGPNISMPGLDST